MICQMIESVILLSGRVPVWDNSHLHEGLQEDLGERDLPVDQHVDKGKIEKNAADSKMYI